MRLAGLVPALLLALLLTQTLVASEEAPLGARTLLPGDNLIGWVGYPTTTEAFFEQIPEAELVYTWDAKLSRYRFAVRGFEAGLSMIEPGMGLVLRIRGSDPVEWVQPTAANGEWVQLHSGPNLVAWTGPSETPINLAVRSIGDTFNQAHFWNPETGEYAIYKPGDGGGSKPMPLLQRGDALWVFNETNSNWLQPSGDRALHPLGPPPDHIRWYRSFDKYLDADGLAFLSTENVADEALFRAAAILDEMLINRPDIRETLVRHRVQTVVYGQSEVILDLAPYRQYRVYFSSEPGGGNPVAGLGPNQYTPTLIAEDELFCYGTPLSAEGSTSVHEFAHAIDYALGRNATLVNFNSTLARAYRSARSSGLWEGTYAARNTDEFWAEAVVAWLGMGSSPFQNRLHLLQYASPIAQLIMDTLGDIQVHSSCQPASLSVKGATRKYTIHGQLTDHLGKPLPHSTIQLGAPPSSWIYRLTSSWPDGGFSMLAPPQVYRLSMSLDGCRLFHTSSGLTTDPLSAEAFSVTDQDVNIDFKLEEPICTIAASGNLLDANGKEVNDYNVVAYGDAGTSRTYASDGERFSVRFPNEGQYSLRFTHRGCEYFYDGVGLVRGPRFDLQFSARLLANTDLNLRLPQGACSGRIVGNVLDENGMPARGFVVGLHIPQGRSRLRIGAQGSFSIRVDLPSKPILEIATQGCRAYFGANGLTLNLDEVTPFELTNKGIEGLKIRISAEFCGLDLMTE